MLGSNESKPLSKSGSGADRLGPSNGALVLTCCVRPVEPRDYGKMADLAEQLGYPSTGKQVRMRLDAMADSSQHAVYVAELPDGQIAGWIGLHVFHCVEQDSRAGDQWADCGPADPPSHNRTAATRCRRRVGAMARLWCYLGALKHHSGMRSPILHTQWIRAHQNSKVLSQGPRETLIKLSAFHNRLS